MKLTTAEALELADEFDLLAMAVGEYRIKHRADLSPSKRRALDEWKWSLFTMASDLATVALGLALDESQVTLAQLKKATLKARRAVKRIETAEGVIKLAKQGWTLAAAIATGNVADIANHSKELVESAGTLAT